MKKFTFILSILLAVIKLQAQDYIISFSGGGASNSVETLKVENLTQGKSITLAGSEILHLKAIVTANIPLLENLDYPMRVYPNPSNGYCTIEFGARKSGTATIKVFDPIGREIAKFPQTVSEGIHSFKISELSNGIYTINVNLDDRSYSEKLIISNSKSSSRLTISYSGYIAPLQEIAKLKSATAERFWQYNTGDRLKFIGTSSKFSTVVVDIPTNSKTIPFNFIECTDADGNNYPIVQIGTQVWMAENLKYLPSVSPSTEVSSTEPRSYVYGYNNTDKSAAKAADNYKMNGVLYNWTAAMNACPTGWHLPTYYEWSILSDYLTGNGYGYEGSGNDIAKSMSSTTLWNSNSNQGTVGNDPYKNNSSGFSGIPGGALSVNLGAGVGLGSPSSNFDFYNIGSIGYWWSSSVFTIDIVFPPVPWVLSLNYNTAILYPSEGNKNNGYCIRCLRGDIVIPLPPTAITNTVTSIAQTTATSGGNVTSDGGSPVTARGVCWSINQNPTKANSKTNDGYGTGSFNSNLTGLTANTKYYVRAFATNSAGTAYGNQVSFTTAQIATSPTLTTATVTNIAQTTATGGGNVTSDGGTTVTARGVCWSTSQNPTIANSKTSDGTGTGNFTSSISGLTIGTTYYVRAYATNSLGTGYGNEISFSAAASLPTLTTTAITTITASTASSGGNITSAGGGIITARGVCWSTTTEPTTASSKTSDGTGLGSFLSSISGLNVGATYYVRAYATNSAGIAYGNEISFTPTSNFNCDPITDIDGNVYKTIKINTCWMAENLRTTKYNDGTVIPNVANSTTWKTLTTPGYCWYNNNEATYKASYGALYNWFAIDVASNGGRNICPNGWHVPTDEQIKQLEIELGMSQVEADAEGYKRGVISAVGTQMKAASGLSVPLAGARFEIYDPNNSGYYFSQSVGYLWSSTTYSSTSAWYRDLSKEYGSVRRQVLPKIMGLSVRCVLGYY
jgi:uncharacterized protein (TIGR02145 family)